MIREDCIFQGDAPFPAGGQRHLTPGLYLLGVFVVFATIYAQYLIAGLGPISGAFTAYGVSILVISLISGARILQRAFSCTVQAVRLGLSLFGIFIVLGTAASLIVFLFLLGLDPKALELLQKPVPVLNVPRELAWQMVVVSILFIGPAEEYIFRGFVYGGLLSLTGGRHWLLLAFVSSILFAAAHLYYALVFGVASLMAFADIVAIGMALAITYSRTGGNLFIPAMIHGVYDATGFLGVALTPNITLSLRGLLTIAGLLVALSRYKQEHKIIS